MTPFCDVVRAEGLRLFRTGQFIVRLSAVPSACTMHTPGREISHCACNQNQVSLRLFFFFPVKFSCFEVEVASEAILGPYLSKARFCTGRYLPLQGSKRERDVCSVRRSEHVIILTDRNAGAFLFFF